jgi:sarcosine oxidase, subunit alpha
VTARRLEARGARIDRSRPIRFTFGGREYGGFEGDTLASALLANDVVGGFRSPILGRPRGVYSAGAEEPNAFVEISAPWFDPVVAATTVELVDGLVAESRAGVGRLPKNPAEQRSPRVEHRHVHVELLVVGSGHAGLYPAEEAAGRGERVLLVEEQPDLDGAGTTWRPEGVTYLTRTTALGLYDEGYAIVLERSPELHRLWHVRAGRVVLATGAYERPIAFAGNDRPGIMLSSALRYLAFGVIPGSRSVVFSAGSVAINTARILQRGGADVAAVADVGPPGEEPVLDGDPEVLSGWVVSGTEGGTRIEAAYLRGPDGETRTVECDSLFVSGGWNPNLTLWRSIGGEVRYDETMACFVPGESGPGWLTVVGAAAGPVPPATPYWFVPADDYSEHFVDLQRDQTVADVAAAVEGGLRSVEHVKRATYIGTAVDQGRTSGVLTAEIVNAMRGAPPGEQGPTSARPPVSPVPFATLAGPDRGHLIDPVRTTPIHRWHLDRGAVFENVGQWKRPRYFPRRGESMDAAVARESAAVRTAAGVLDASTLGKIEVIGPDAGEFLDRMYTNRMSDLGVGRIRYGLMLGLDGMVMDDGVAMRLADDHFFVTTTTGGAAAVLDRFEEWLQTEWPDLRVSCTSVTEQWADVALAGPRARDVLGAVGSDLDLSPQAIPFMTVRDGAVAGVPARVARVSFTGELSYEINVAAWHGRYMWETVMAAGESFGIAPYGTEAMHLLRAEKGFPIVGQETDGTVTPDDLGMSWIVERAKRDFVGKRSLRRPDALRPDRKQLVGLLPADPEALLPEGAQLVLEDTGTIPMTMAGHVTSSYKSAVLGRTFALAMVHGGRGLRGATVFAPLLRGTIAAEVTSPVFWDPENRRRDGDPGGDA